jgi:hypothetical protein
VQLNIFDLLGLERTHYDPPLAYQSENQCAPTEYDYTWREQLLRCVVNELGGKRERGINFLKLNKKRAINQK